jgi:O-antigen ligase
MFFRNMRMHWRLAAGGIAAFCLVLTQMRSGWVGFGIATLATALFYWRHRALVIGSIAFLLLIGIQSAVTFNPAMVSQGAATWFRTDSISTLSGRLPLWEASLQRFMDQPLLGYGFMYGSDALLEDMATLAASGDASVRVFLNSEKFTLHSGYIQALLDSGALGALLYFFIVFAAVISIVRKDKYRQFGAVLYTLVFSMVFNLAETYIKGSGSFSSVFYWYSAIFSFGLPAMQAVAPRRPPRTQEV